MDVVLEKFFSDVGGCGAFQLCLVACIFSINIVATWSMLLMVFGSFNPGCWCGDSDSTDETVFQNIKYVANLSNQHLQTTCDIDSTCTDIRFNPSASTIVTEWALLHEQDWLLSVIISVQMFSVLVGCFCSGYFGNAVGRKINMYSWLTLCAVTNIVAVFSVSPIMFAVIRFFIGMSIGGILAMVQIYCLDFVTSRYRPYISGFPVWLLGHGVFGVFVFILKDWKHLHIVTAVLTLVLLFTALWVPENVRWLAVRGKLEKSQKVAKQICHMNKKACSGDRILNFEFETSNKQQEKGTKKFSYFVIFRRSLIKRTIIAYLIFFLSAFMFYLIGFGIRAFFGDFYLNFGLFSILSMPCAILVPILGNRLGRRLGMITLYAISGALALTVVIVRLTLTGSGPGIYVTLASILSCAFVDQAWSLMLTYVVELFPTEVRNLATGFAFTGARVGGIVAPYISPVSYETLHISFIVVAVCNLVCCLLLAALPETKGNPLPDTMEEFEKKMYMKPVERKSDIVLFKPIQADDSSVHDDAI